MCHLSATGKVIGESERNAAWPDPTDYQFASIKCKSSRHNQKHHEHGEHRNRDEKQDFGDPGRRSGHSGKAEEAGDQRYNKENQSPFQHYTVPTPKFNEKPRKSISTLRLRGRDSKRRFVDVKPADFMTTKLLGANVTIVVSRKDGTCQVCQVFMLQFVPHPDGSADPTSDHSRRALGTLSVIL